MTCIDGDLRVCVYGVESPDSLLGPQRPVEGQIFFLFFEQQVSEDAKSENRGVLQSEINKKRQKKRKLVEISNTPTLR